MLRIECPSCGTSFNNAHLKLKTSLKDKAILRCVCDKSLSVTFIEEEVAGEDTRSWFGRLREDPIPTTRVLVAQVEVNES